MGTTAPLITVIAGPDPATAVDIRSVVRDLVSEVGVDEVASDAALLTTELVASAFERGSRELILYAECDPRHVRVEVGDAFRSGAWRARVAESDAEAIRRRLLDELTDGWGSVVSDDGELVWFDVGIRSRAL